MTPIVLDLPAIALAALQSTAVAALLLGAERLLRGPRREWRTGLVFLALAKFAVPAWLAWPLLALRPGAAPAGGAAPALAWLPAVLLAVWAAGALVSLARFVLRRAALARRIAASSPCSDPTALALLDRAARRAGLGAAPELRITATGAAPFTAGILRPRVVVPARWIERLDPDALAAVFLHESVHVRRRDVLRLEAASLLGAIWWWNPVCAVAEARWRALIEDACDDRVVSILACAPESYCRSLLSAARLAVTGAAPEPAGAAGIGAHDFERRLRRLMTAGGARRGSRTALRLTLAAAAILLLPFVGIAPRAESARARAAESSLHDAHARRHAARHARHHAHQHRPHVHTIPATH